MSVPPSVGESLVPRNVLVDPVTLRIGVADPTTGIFLGMTQDMLEEVAAVYNAWRVGNLQDVTIKDTQQLRRINQ